MLLRLEEFCRLTDMIRSDTSQILAEDIPLLKVKVSEMSGIYARVDQLEAFVKMVGNHVSFLEAHVLQAERDHATIPGALWWWLASSGLPTFRTSPQSPPGMPVDPSELMCMPPPVRSLLGLPPPKMNIICLPATMKL
ncbi:breast carcinoma-amplified sequence 4 [Echinops telfairi]|uniref:Breast carcinoma-amplified sequence 4 n=1 Tax=Echinops telfairi TaxID=9371 RepID=A0AC55DHY2_ECHTE|nr:breast carcinoma-amplified sequence 4 [Echinops telfairi]